MFLFSFSFAQNPPFGQGSFFGGLGGKPSEENASKNVFASAAKSTDNTSSSKFNPKLQSNLVITYPECNKSLHHLMRTVWGAAESL